MVHAAMLLSMFGFAAGALGGWEGNTFIPEGTEQVAVASIRPVSPLGTVPAGAEAVLHLNEFRIDYRENGQVRATKY